MDNNSGGPARQDGAQMPPAGARTLPPEQPRMANHAEGRRRSTGTQVDLGVLRG